MATVQCDHVLDGIELGSHNETYSGQEILVVVSRLSRATFLWGIKIN